MKELRGRTAILTGASRGVGVYDARALAKEGMNLVLAARDAPGLDACRKEVEAQGVRSISVPIDLRDPAAPAELVKRAQGAFGEIDVLVNNAGIEDIGVLEATDPQSILDSIAVNLTAPILLTRLLLPGMLERDRGHIVNIASLAGITPNAYSEVYAATKHGVVGFTRSLRATVDGERKRSAVGFSSICPGFISTVGMAEEMRVNYGVIPPAMLGVSHPETVARARGEGDTHQRARGDCESWTDAARCWRSRYPFASTGRMGHTCFSPSRAVSNFCRGASQRAAHTDSR